MAVEHPFAAIKKKIHDSAFSRGWLPAHEIKKLNEHYIESNNFKMRRNVSIDGCFTMWELHMKHESLHSILFLQMSS